MESNTQVKRSVPFLKKKKVNDYLFAYILCLPALVLFAVFRFYPLVEAFRTSFFDYIMITGDKIFIGLRNYIDAFNDPLFLKSLGVSFKFVILLVPLEIIVALLLAIFLQKPGLRNTIVRSAVFLPVVTAFVVASVVWTMMFHPTNGLFNGILAGMGFNRMSFLTSPKTAIPSLVIFLIWKEAGYYMIFYIAGLQGIPDEYYEAAAIDGSNAVRSFFYITIPLLKNTTIFVVLMTTISSLKIFTPIYIMTKGGPQYSTQTAVYNIYQYGFIRNEMGYASASSVILLLIILVIGIIQLRVGDKE